MNIIFLDVDGVRANNFVLTDPLTGLTDNDVINILNKIKN